MRVVAVISNRETAVWPSARPLLMLERLPVWAKGPGVVPFPL